MELSDGGGARRVSQLTIDALRGGSQLAAEEVGDAEPTHTRGLSAAELLEAELAGAEMLLNG